MAPRVGIDAYSLTGPSRREICEPDVFAMLRTVKELGADGLQSTVPDDPAEMGRAFDLAAELGLYLEPYVRLPIHFRNDAEQIELRRRRLPRLCAACAERGIRALHCTMGARERFEDLPRWKEFVQATAACVRDLGPMLREHGLRLGIENHWDYTTYEIVEIAERAGPDLVGVGLDTGNLPILGEAPAAAVERSAPYTVTTHLKEFFLISTPTGAARPLVTLGDGQVGMAEAVKLLYRHNPELNFTIEDHAVIYPLDYFERWWLEAVPELTTGDVAAMARLARQGDGWVHQHLVADPHAAELVPWSIRGPGRLKEDVARVKTWLAEA
ncbi:MAG TPA: sugar phosphate isomerase/epimerase [Chloroflexota bacterium]|jgi:sugar phosphate isomerase/epimerase